MAREVALVVTAETQQATQALQQTESALKGVEQAAEKTDKSLSKAEQGIEDLRNRLTTARAEADKMSDALRRKSDSAGAATQATSGLVSVIGRYVAAGTVPLAIKHSLDFADNLKELSQQSGFSVKSIQTLGFVAQNAGSSFQAVANAANMLDRNLSIATPKVERAIKDMGLSISDLLAMQPEDRFREIGIAIGRTEDPAERAERAFALFGRAGAQLLPMFEDLAEGAETYAPRMSSAWVENMAKVQSATETAWGWMKNFGMWVATFPIHASMQAWASAIDLYHTATMNMGTLPGLPGRPNSPLLAAPSTAFDPLNGQSMGFWERTLTQSAQEQIRAGTRRPGSSVIDVPQYMFSGGTPVPLRGSLGFPGFAIPGLRQNLNFAPYAGMLPARQNLNFAPFAGGVPMNAPGGGSGGFFGNMFGNIGGGIKDLWKGMSGGKGIGGLLGNMGSGLITGGLSSLLGMGVGLIGKGFGKLFGGLFGGEGKKTNRTRDAFISENFGSVDALREAASEAGFSVERMLSVKKVKDFEAEVGKLNEALGEHARKAKEIEELNGGILGTLGELTGMGADIDGLFGAALGDLREMGRLSGDVESMLAGMTTEVDYRKMDEAARRLGITDTSGLGQSYQNQRIGANASQMVNDIDLLIRGGADLNAVLGGSKENISKLVVDALKFGTELPGQMQPWIEQLMRSGDLVDENGEKLTDVSQLKFGKPIETEFDKLIKKLDELIGKLSGPLVDSIEDVPDVDFDVNVNVNRTYPEEDPTTETGFDAGGVAGRDWRRRSMRDTIPAWLRPGEVVLTPEQARGMSVQINGLTVGGGMSRAETAEQVGKAVVAYMERRGVRFGRRVA